MVALGRQRQEDCHPQLHSESSTRLHSETLPQKMVRKTNLGKAGRPTQVGEWAGPVYLGVDCRSPQPMTRLPVTPTRRSCIINHKNQWCLPETSLKWTPTNYVPEAFTSFPKEFCSLGQKLLSTTGSLGILVTPVASHTMRRTPCGFWLLPLLLFVVSNHSAAPPENMPLTDLTAQSCTQKAPFRLLSTGRQPHQNPMNTHQHLLG